MTIIENYILQLQNIHLRYCDLEEIYIWSFRGPKYSSHIYLVFTHNSCLTVPKTLGIFLSVESDKGVFRYINMVTFGKLLRIDGGWLPGRPNHMIRELELSVPPPDLWGEETDWRWNQTSMTSDLINHALCNEASIKTHEDGV